MASSFLPSNKISTKPGQVHIVDVGFGVHCVLPILKLIGEDSGATILMQQPKTHLHPMAQALLAQFIAESEGRYVIETHADHIINRLCICVRKGEVTPGDVEIFWFEQRERRNNVVIHEIKIDEAKNAIEGFNLRSNDSQTLALAIAYKAKFFCTNDNDLKHDFKDVVPKVIGEQAKLYPVKGTDTEKETFLAENRCRRVTNLNPAKKHHR